MEAHAAFDPIWMDGPIWGRSKRRRQTYRWLAREMGLHPRRAHIGLMGVEGCAEVVRISLAHREKKRVRPSWVE